MKKLVALSLVLGVAACADGPAPLAPPASPAAAANAANTGDYVVVFTPDVADAPGLARRLTSQHGGQLRAAYQHAIKGFAVRGLPAAAVEALARHPQVAYVEPDAPAQLFVTQSPATWGIDRVDQRDTPLSNSYTYLASGTGVNAYIFDTGVNLGHSEFGGRASYVPNGANGDFVGDGRGNASDCHGHGTHVAGTVGGTTWGVAKQVRIWAARVVNCQGSGQVSMAIAAVDWATANALRPAVVNMSLGYGDVQSLRDAVEASVAAGVSYGVAAGNGDFLGRPQNACLQSPAGAANAVTVGATTSSDTESSFSNYGPCVDILAPGSSITSAAYNSTSGSTTMSGTSMATPHVVGAMALYLEGNPSASPAQVTAALKNGATPNTITLHSRSASNGTPNLFLYTAGFGGGGEPGNTPPVAEFAFSCSGLTCSFTDQSGDADGSLVSWSWSFGDGGSSTAQSPTHTYASGGTRTVTLTVTDDDGATASRSRTVTVSDPTATISLSVSGQKVRGVATANLAWSGASGSSVDVYRNGALVATTANDGSHADSLGRGASGTFSYRVCEAGTTSCSNVASVTF